MYTHTSIHSISQMVIINTALPYLRWNYGFPEKLRCFAQLFDFGKISSLLAVQRLTKSN